LGSGKFGTPWDRMQLANASAPAFLLVGPLLLVVAPEEPQAAIAIAQLIAATAIERPRRCLLAALLVLALRNVVGFPPGSVDGRSQGFYRWPHNKAVKLLCRR
jgi:hypothetical protein